MILAFVLIVLVLFLYQVWITRTQKGKVAPTAELPEVPAEEVERRTEAVRSDEAAQVSAVAERDVVVDTDLLRIVVTNVGLKSVQLKGYDGLGGGWIEEAEELVKVSRTESMARLVKELRNGYKGVEAEEVPGWAARIDELVTALEKDYGDVEGELKGRVHRMGLLPSWLEKNYRGWVELIPYGERALGLDVPEVDLASCAFRIERSGLPEGERVRFVYSLSAGDSLTKEFTFRNGTYQWGLRLLGADVDNLQLKWGGGLAVTEENKKDDLGYASAVVSLGGKYQKRTLVALKKDGEAGWREPGRVDWVGLRTKYFLACLIPQDPLETAGFEARFDSLPGRISAHRAAFGCMRAPVVEGRASIALDTRGRDLTVYVGPLDYDTLKSMGVGLERVVDLGWGWISPISRGILALFKAIYRLIPNYGVVIITFSCIMMVVFFPLTRRGLHQMQEMQKLQPKMEALRKKFKNEPQKLNVEIMKLYRQQGVNPLGGCLPLVFQMPVFFALFSVLRSTIELRRAGFMLWIDDLSIPDTIGHIGELPVHVLPILMLISMVIQQRFTTMDPRQKAMAYMMPIMFTFIFWNFPAGLVLYWLSYNVLSIIQHWLVRRREGEGKGVV